MSWPSPQEYNEAIQTPHLSFNDPELRRGRLELTPLGLPKPMTGAFASVYRVRCKDRDWAVRCFLRDTPGIQSRYVEISKFVMTDDLPYTVSFDYLPQGIRVQNTWYPVLKMEWVEGIPLEQYVQQHLNNSAKLSSLVEKFDQMMRELAEAGIAHGDLQHGNIMVVDDELRLVDYDGMYVPSLKGCKSNEIGHRNYQHPARTHHHFGPDLDNFSSWVIRTCLNCISIDPGLWPRLTGGDECLLFKQADFKRPQASKAFYILEQHPEETIHNSARLLRHIMQYGPDEVPRFTAHFKSLDDLPALRSTGARPTLQNLPASFIPENPSQVTMEVSPTDASGLWDQSNIRALAGASAFEVATNQPWPARNVAPAAAAARQAQGQNTPAYNYAHQGLLQTQMNNHMQALRYFDKALELDRSCDLAYYGRAIAHYALQNNEVAISDLEQATKFNGKNAKAFEMLGLLLTDAGKHTQAQLALNRCLKLDPHNERALACRAFGNIERKQYSTAVKDYDQVLQMNQRNPDYYLGRALGLYHLKQFPQAMRDLEVALKLNGKLPKAWYLRGLIDIENKDYESAVRCFTNAILDSPQDGKSYYGRGTARLELKRYREALSDFKDALNRDTSNSTLIYRGMGLANYGLRNYLEAAQLFDTVVQRDSRAITGREQLKVDLARGFACLQREDFRTALKHFEMAYAYSKIPYEACLGRGTTHFKLLDYSQALADLNRALELNEKSADVYAMRGQTYLATKDVKAAERDITKALQLDSTNSTALCGMGWLQRFNGDHVLAAQYFTRAIELDVANADSYFGRAMTYESMREYNKAIAEYELAIRFSPRKVDAYLQLGDLYLMLERNDDARRTFDVAAQIAPRNPRAHYGRAIADMQLNNLGQALNGFDQTISLDSKHGMAYCHRATVLRKQWRVQEALDSVNVALMLNPKALAAYLLRSDIYLELGKTAEAVADCEKALEIDVTHHELLFARGMHMMKQKLYNEAVKDFSAAIKSNPANLKAYHQRSAAYKALGKRAEALEDLTAAIKLQPIESFFLERAELYTSIKEYALALEDINYHIKIKPKAGDAYFLRAAIYGKLNDFKNARGDYETVIMLQPLRAEAYLGHGSICSYQRDVEQALSSFEKALSLQPELTKHKLTTDYWRTNAYRKTRSGDYNEAITSFTNALAIEPEDTSCLLGRASCYQDSGQHLEAIQDFRSAIARNDHLSTAYEGCAVSHWKLKQYDEAITCLNTALTLDPGNNELLLERSRVFFDMEEYDKAITDLAKIKEKDANDPVVWFHLGRISHALGCFEDALQAVEISLDQRPRWAEALCLRGLCLFEIGELKSAMNDFTLAIQQTPELNEGSGVKMNPELAASFTGRGCVYLAEKKYGHALADFTSALYRDENYYEAHLGMAHAYNGQKRYTSAIESIAQALKINDTDPRLYEARGFAYSKLNEFEKSAKDYRRAQDLAAPEELTPMPKI